jgi:L-threonylcarbamoyladenylate synthase
LVSPRDERSVLETLSGVAVLDLGPTAASAAQRLYAALRDADARGASVVLASPPAAEDWRGLTEAVADRLSKAAGPRP